MNSKFSGRLGASFESVIRKNGIRLQRLDRKTGATREILNVGGACSEVLTGERLAKIMEPSFKLQEEMMVSLRNNSLAPCLSNHTSAGVAQNLDQFTHALTQHLPWIKKNQSNNEDWFISLQTEGASAVWAACDLLLQIQHDCNSNLRTTSRKLVAVGAKSYHGPGSTSYGSAAPLGPKSGSISYPVPSMLAPGSTKPPSQNGHSIEHQAIKALDEWFDKKSDNVAVLLVEPQWGSSQIGLPWPPAVLHHLVKSAKDRGIMVCADEIMCGLGRHGKGGMFLSGQRTSEHSIADLVDAVTFGKAIAGGCGDLLSGVAVKQGADHLSQSQRSVLQSHTYAGASARALSIACEVLNEMPNIERYVSKGEEIVEKAMNRLTIESKGAVVTQGQGLLWGGIFSSASPQEASQAVRLFCSHCDRLEVQAYPVNDGFMITPPLDAALCGNDLQDAMDGVVEAALVTAEEMGWLRNPPQSRHLAIQY